MSESDHYREHPGFKMKKLSLIAFALVCLICLAARSGLAQGSADTPAAAAPAPVPSPAPAASPAPGASATAAASPSESTPSADAGQKTATAKKKRAGQMTRQEEIDRSIRNGTVPSRYRSRIPREYQQYIPFEKQ
jgi:hypothetical protein